MHSKSIGYINFAAVKEAVSLEQILEHYGILANLEPSGPKGLRGCCPIHGGNDPKQFSVTLNKNLWNCFSQCNQGGNHLEFVATMEQCTMGEAAWKLNEWFGLGFKNLTPSKSIPSKKSGLKSQKETSSKPHGKGHPSKPDDQQETGENKPLAFCLQNLDPSHPYLTERGLNSETIAEFGIAFCPKGIMGGRVVIPIHNSAGELVAYTGRWPGDSPEGKEKYRFPSGFKKSLELFNIHRALAEPDDQLLVIVAGFFEAMYLWQNGHRKAVALMSSSLSHAQEELIAQMVNSQTRIILLLGSDELGNESKEKIAYQLAKHCFVHFCHYPNGQLDTSHLKQYQLSALHS